MYMRTRYFIAGILLLALFAGCSSDSGEGDAPGGGSGDTTGDTDVVAPKTNDLPVIALLTAGMLGFAGIAVAAKRRKV